MMDMAERYLQRTEMLLRLIDPEGLGHLVDHEARQEIARVLRLTDGGCPAPSQLAAEAAIERE